MLLSNDVHQTKFRLKPKLNITTDTTEIYKSIDTIYIYIYNVLRKTVVQLKNNCSSFCLTDLLNSFIVNDLKHSECQVLWRNTRVGENYRSYLFIYFFKNK